MLQIGSVVDGKYKILSEVGHGGMSVVYLAINERANKTWAIKEVRKDGTTDFETTRQGLIAETDILKKLKHPHIVSIIDVLEYQDSFLIVMDYIEGRSLQKLIDSGGAQPADRVIEWGKQLCDVLGYLHSRQPPIIYRDMKPANVMLQPSGDVILTDFGTAREYKMQNLEDTTCLGTRGYAAPEQFGGHGQTDGRTDIYCLGVTMYHLLTGHSPLETNSVIPPLRRWDPRFAETGIEKIILKCCQPEAQNRYQDCAELMYALEHVDDFDNAAIRRRKLKWGGFLGACVMTLLSAAGMIGCHFGAVSATTRSYTYYLSMAGSVNTFADAAGYCSRAVSLDPGNPEAYNKLLDVIDDDVVFTSEENTALLACINGTDGGSRTNLDRLASADREEWAKFVYRLANDYYFFYEGTDNRTKAANWYSQILDNAYLTDQERLLAQSLNTIGNYYSSLSSDKNIYKGGSYNYQNFWQDLVALTDGDVVAKVGGTHYAVGLYQELISQIANAAERFRSFGVTEAEMRGQIQKVEEALAGLPDSGNDIVSRQIVQINTEIERAKQMVNATFASGVEG